MAARGAEAKEKIMNQILTQFEGAFKYDKEIRVPVMENGELVQIKITLTAAKVNVESGMDTAIPVPAEPMLTPGGGFDEFERPNVEVTEEEKATVANLLASLGL